MNSNRGRTCTEAVHNEVLQRPYYINYSCYAIQVHLNSNSYRTIDSLTTTILRQTQCRWGWTVYEINWYRMSVVNLKFYCSITWVEMKIRAVFCVSGTIWVKWSCSHSVNSVANAKTRIYWVHFFCNENGTYLRQMLCSKYHPNLRFMMHTTTPHVTSYWRWMCWEMTGIIFSRLKESRTPNSSTICR